MRILHVSQPIVAGVPNVIKTLVVDERKRGYDVHVACPAGDGLAQDVRGRGAEHHPWAATRKLGGNVVWETCELNQIVNKVDPAVVVLHAAKAGLAGRLAIRGRRPTVFVPHAWSFEAVRGVIATASRMWEVGASRWTNLLICVSDDERLRGRAAGVSCATQVIPNGVDVATRVPVSASVARRQLALPDLPIVVCLGRVVEQKGQDLLLRAWPAVRAAVPDALLVIVGDGGDAARLRATAPDGVLFVGARDDGDLFLAAADVVALPSRWEGASLVLLEAMAASRPVVAFGVDGVRATIGDAGVVVAPGDTSAMGAALSQLLVHRDDAVAIGHAARERIARVADLQTSLHAWDAALTGLVASKLPPPASAARTSDLNPTGTPYPARSSGAGPQPFRSEKDDVVPTGPPISVVITVLNEGRNLDNLVAQLLPQLHAHDEIVIVDGGSTDGSIESLRSNPAVRVAILPGAGISAGRNHGIRIARNEVIACTDAGCVPAPGFLAGFRGAFSRADPPALVSGVYTVSQRNRLERAQGFACYPQPDEVRHPRSLVRLYTRVFGSGFDPRFAVGRCVAFRRTAWAEVGGFPEHLATGEDVSFSLAVARVGECVASPDAVVEWEQRDGLRETWRMYRRYGQASTDGGDPALLARDAMRGLAYLLAPMLLTRPVGRRLLAVGAAAYLSLPAIRAVRGGEGLGVLALLPAALATKDLGKLTGAVQGLRRKHAEQR